jgi:solute:Na+ symporter, SSS family
LAPDVKPSRDGLSNLLDWIAGCVLIYGVLFGTGKILLHETGIGIALLVAGLAGGAVIYWDLSRRGWSAVVD